MSENISGTDIDKTRCSIVPIIFIHAIPLTLLFLLLVIILPRFVSNYNARGYNLPVITQIFLTMSMLIRKLWCVSPIFLACPIALVCWVYCLLYRRHRVLAWLWSFLAFLCETTIGFIAIISILLPAFGGPRFLQ